MQALTVVDVFQELSNGSSGVLAVAIVAAIDLFLRERFMKLSAFALS